MWTVYTFFEFMLHFCWKKPIEIILHILVRWVINFDQFKCNYEERGVYIDINYTNDHYHNIY